ncbi:MAG: hypothetical protein V4685_18905 [Bacteroidota bacterium]
MKPLYITGFFILAISINNYAQDTLPRISVKNINNKVIISWRATYGATITAINIQRSADSLKNFTSIGSVLEPNNRENGFVDSKAPSTNMFYRVFVAFAGGSYIFSKSYKPVIDTFSSISPGIQTQPEYEGTPGFIASRYIFTGKDNNIIIDLPDAATSKYSIKFFDDNDKPVFEISKVTEPYLIIEKVNFLHAGWFYFKLYENGVIKEKHQFYIPREGKYGIPPEEIKKRFK